MTHRRPLIVVSQPMDIDGCPEEQIATADQYLENGARSQDAESLVINLCDTVRYGSKGYYVSLLADARGQQVLPDLDTIAGLAEPYARFRAMQEAGIPTIDAAEMTMRRRAAGLEEAAHPQPQQQQQQPMQPLTVAAGRPGSYRFAEPHEYVEIDVVLGQCVETEFQAIAAAVFRVWAVPLLRIQLMNEDDEWKVTALTPISPADVEPGTRECLARLLAFPPGARITHTTPTEVRAALAVLVDAGNAFSPSSPETIDRLEQVAARRNVHVARIALNELRKVAEYDALFVRCHTGVTQPAFQFALRAEALGMPVVDDPQSTMRCTNKVFMEELLHRANLPTPNTRIITATTPWQQIEQLGMPFVLKLPDGDFSAAVHKIADRSEFERIAAPMFVRSPLLIAQEWLPTEFDWRIGVLGGRLLFAARYYMARGHWQIRSVENGTERYGRVQAVRRHDAPPAVVQLALQAASLVGDGFYGIDLKETARGPVLIEVNDNPNLDTGYEDAADGDAIYEDLIEYFVHRIDAAGSSTGKVARAVSMPAASLPSSAPVPLPQSSAPNASPLLPEPEAALTHKRQEYRLFEVAGIELEYPIVDRDLNVASLVEPAFRILAGRGTSDVDLGSVSFSNEFADHVFEIKTVEPVASLQDAETLLNDGLQRFLSVLHEEFDARLLPTGMHPWFNPLEARLWTRSGLRIYTTYARLFNVRTHGWMNVQAMHLNLPFGTESETIAMHNASALLIPYLPAIAASTPIFDGVLQDSADSRLVWLTRHQQRVPESMGRIVPEYITSIADYRKRILKPMYNALDQMVDAGAIRHEFFNSRSAILRFARRAFEIRALDTQECIKMDVALAAFVRGALAGLTRDLLDRRLELPDHATLVHDLHECIRDGSGAMVRAPHCNPGSAPMHVRDVLRRLLDMSVEHAAESDAHYLEQVRSIIEAGSLSERIRHRLAPYASEGPDVFREQVGIVYGELADALEGNIPWPGRFADTEAVGTRAKSSTREQIV